jgi:hypothetical protein
MAIHGGNTRCRIIFQPLRSSWWAIYKKMSLRDQSGVITGVLRRPFCPSGLCQRMLGYMATWEIWGVHYAANHVKGLTEMLNSSMNRQPASSLARFTFNWSRIELTRIASDSKRCPAMPTWRQRGEWLDINDNLRLCFGGVLTSYHALTSR